MQERLTKEGLIQMHNWMETRTLTDRSSALFYISRKLTVKVVLAAREVEAKYRTALTVVQIGTLRTKKFRRVFPTSNLA